MTEYFVFYTTEKSLIVEPLMELVDCSLPTSFPKLAWLVLEEHQDFSQRKAEDMLLKVMLKLTDGVKKT